MHYGHWNAGRASGLSVKVALPTGIFIERKLKARRRRYDRRHMGKKILQSVAIFLIALVTATPFAFSARTPKHCCGHSCPMQKKSSCTGVRSLSFSSKQSQCCFEQEQAPEARIVSLLPETHSQVLATPVPTTVVLIETPKAPLRKSLRPKPRRTSELQAALCTFLI